MNKEKLSAAVRLIAWGYVLQHLNLNFGTLNLLPGWLGYMLMLSALPALSEEEPSALLLRPLGIMLAVWDGVVWALAIFGVTPNIAAISVIEAALSLYFHFQLLTNLAGIALTYQCPEAGKIIVLRTVRTVLITVLAIPLPWEEYNVTALWERYEALVVAVMAVHIIVAIWICHVLFSLRRSLEASCVVPQGNTGEM